MSIRDMVPRKRHEHPLARREEVHPYRDFQREMNRLFDEFFGEFPLMAREGETGWLPGAFVPRVDVSETDTEIKATAELPGMDEKDISVELEDNFLTLRGEKKTEQEEKEKNWFHREQSYGSFHRVIALPAGVDASKATAKFRKGVLTVVAPKREEEKSKRKTVPIQAE